jgi:hypothetical protein
VKRRERRGEERIGGGGKGREDDVNGVKRYEKWRGEERREEQERSEEISFVEHRSLL